MEMAFALNKGTAAGAIKEETCDAASGSKTLLDAVPGQTYIS